MKIKDYLLTALLSFTIIVSIVLSAILWYNPAYYERNKSNDTNNTKVQMTNHSFSYVYAPFQIIKTDQNGAQNMLTNKSVNLVDRILSVLKNYNHISFADEHKKSAKYYFKILNQKNALILNYSNNINTQIFGQIINNSKINQQFKTFPNHAINRIVIPTRDHNCIYLLSDNSYEVYTLKVNYQSWKNVIKDLNSNSVKHIPIKIVDRNNIPFIEFLNDISMPQYGYIINRQNISYYASYLNFPSNSKTNHHRTIYDNNSRQLESDDQTSQVIYSTSQENMMTNNIRNLLNNGYENIMRLGLNLDNVHFYNYDADKQTLYYRYFVEGFPILGHEPWSMIKIEAQYNTDVRYYFSLNNLEVPVPTGLNNVSLPATNKVLTNLKAVGYNVNHISDIEIGYHASRNTNHNSDILINLVPDLYINYNGNWMTYNQMLYHK